MLDMDILKKQRSTNRLSFKASRIPLVLICFCISMLSVNDVSASQLIQNNKATLDVQTQSSGNPTIHQRPSAIQMEKKADSVIVPYLAETVTIDGIVDESVWKEAATVPLTFVTRPFENTVPPVSTTARIFENGENIYIAFSAQDNDISQIRALFRDRDSVWNNDLVGIKIDTFGDSRLSYQFFVNPHGIQTDAIENQMTRS